MVNCSLVRDLKVICGGIENGTAEKETAIKNKITHVQICPELSRKHMSREMNKGIL
jgi:hypothetical protein